MSKQWTPVIHREYNHSLRRVVADNDRYALGVAIWDKLVEVDDPTEGAEPVPNRSGRFTVVIMGYIISFEVSVDDEGKILASATEIKLLPIEKLQ